MWLGLIRAVPFWIDGFYVDKLVSDMTLDAGKEQKQLCTELHRTEFIQNLKEITRGEDLAFSLKHAHF